MCLKGVVELLLKTPCGDGKKVLYVIRHAEIEKKIATPTRDWRTFFLLPCISTRSLVVIQAGGIRFNGMRSMCAF